MQIKKTLANFGLSLPVKSKTLSCSGLGYGTAWCSNITCQEAIGDDVKAALRAVADTFRNSGAGPEFSERQKSAYIIGLRGPAYPWGGAI